MKFYVPTNPLWYFAVLVLIVPFFIINFINPAWVVRLFALFVFYIGIATIGLYYVFSIKRTIQEDAPLVKKLGKTTMVWVIRIFLTGLLAAICIPVILPLGKDAIAIIKNEAPLTRTGRVVSKSSGPIAGYFIKTIVMDSVHITSENSYSAPYFPLRYFEVGKDYEILYIPNSRIILEARLK